MDHMNRRQNPPTDKAGNGTPGVTMLFQNFRIQTRDSRTNTLVFEVAFGNEKLAQAYSSAVEVNMNTAAFYTRLVKGPVLVTDKGNILEVVQITDKVIAVRSATSDIVYEIFHKTSPSLTVIDDWGFHPFDGFGKLSAESVQEALKEA
jgi:hypothetical protein